MEKFDELDNDFFGFLKDSQVWCPRCEDHHRIGCLRDDLLSGDGDLGLFCGVSGDLLLVVPGHVRAAISRRGAARMAGKSAPPGAGDLPAEFGDLMADFDREMHSLIFRLAEKHGYPALDELISRLATGSMERLLAARGVAVAPNPGVEPGNRSPLGRLFDPPEDMPGFAKFRPLSDIAWGKLDPMPSSKPLSNGFIEKLQAMDGKAIPYIMADGTESRRRLVLKKGKGFPSFALEPLVMDLMPPETFTCGTCGKTVEIMDLAKHVVEDHPEDIYKKENRHE